MKLIFKLGAFIGLGITLISPFLAWSMMIDLELNKSMMLFGTIVWFICAPLATNENVSAKN